MCFRFEEERKYFMQKMIGLKLYAMLAALVISAVPASTVQASETEAVALSTAAKAGFEKEAKTEPELVENASTTELVTEEKTGPVTEDKAELINEDKAGLSSEGLAEDQAGDLGDEEIIAIEAPSSTKVTIENKSTLANTIEELPETLTVQTKEGTFTIKAEWKCDGDYNDLMGIYPFVPDMSRYSLADDAELPVIYVEFTDEGKSRAGEPFDIPDMPVIKSSSSGGDLINSGSLPRTYNLFAENKLPPVRDQGNFGTCWSFSTIGCLESDLIKDGGSTQTDLSELHLAYYAYNNYKDPKGCRTDTIREAEHKEPRTFLMAGGNGNIAGRVLSGLQGAVDEKTVPYNQALTFNPGTKIVRSKDSVRVDRAYWFGKEANEIKKNIMAHGGVSTLYNDDDKYYTATDNCYYCPEEKGTNHVVMLVGWDDDFSKDKFGITPEGDGAWLVRNSWGFNGYGHTGYFWLSYYDKNIPNLCVSFDASKNTFDNCYGYDGQTVNDRYVTIEKSDKVTQRFKVDKNETVKAVGIELDTENVTVTVTVKNKKTGKTSTGKVNTSYGGFYTIPLEKDLDVPDSATVEVTYRFNKLTKLSVENTGNRPFVSFIFTGKCDKGFYINGEKENYDLRAKLFTDKKIAVKKVTLNKDKITVKKGKTKTLKATISPQNAADKKLTWSSSNKKVATVSKKGVVKGKKKGTATITVKASSGKKATCKVIVK